MPIGVRVFHTRLDTTLTTFRPPKDTSRAPTIQGQVSPLGHGIHNDSCRHQLPSSTLDVPCRLNLPSSTLGILPTNGLETMPPSLITHPPFAAWGSHKWRLVGVHLLLTSPASHTPEERWLHPPLTCSAPFTMCSRCGTAIGSPLSRVNIPALKCHPHPGKKTMTYKSKTIMTF